MTERVRARVQRVERFLEQQKRRKRSPPTSRHGSRKPPVSGRRALADRLKTLHAQSLATARLYESAAVVEEYEQPEPLASARMDSSRLRLRLLNPGSSANSASVLPQSTRSIEVLLPGSIVRNPVLTQRIDPLLATQTIEDTKEKRVWFCEDSPEVFCFQKYLNDPELEYCTDIEELQEVRMKQELFRVAASQVDYGQSDSLPAVKLDVRTEKIYGELKRKQAEAQGEVGFGEEMTQLTELNNTLRNEIDTLRQKEAMGSSTQGGASTNDATVSFDGSCEATSKSKAPILVVPQDKSSVSTTETKKPIKASNAEDNSGWLKTWSFVEAVQSKIVYGTINDSEMTEFEKTFSAFPEKLRCVKARSPSGDTRQMASTARMVTCKNRSVRHTTATKSLPRKIETLRIECSTSPKTERPKSEAPLKSLLKKGNRTPRLHKKVKFDATSIKSEGRALRKYADVKMKEYNEGRWLQRLGSMFASQNENEDRTNIDRDVCNTPEFNKSASYPETTTNAASSRPFAGLN